MRRKRPRSPLLVVALASSLVAGCSLLIDTGDLAGPAGGAGGGSEAGSTREGGSAADSGGDSGGDGATSGNYCANESPTHVFCADFDQQALDFGWTAVASDGNAPVDLDTLARSAPRSLRTRVATPGQCRYAGLRKNLAGPYQSGRLAFDLRLGTAASPTFADAYVARIESGKCNHIVQVTQTQTSVYSQIDYPVAEDRKSAAVAIVPGEWRRVALDVDRSDGSIRLSIDGTVVIPKIAVDARCIGAAEMTVSVGLYCQGAVAEARFDNVTFDAQ